MDRINDSRATTRMFMLSSLLTMFCFAWLAMPPQWTRSPMPGIISFAGGIGFSPRKFGTSMLCHADTSEVLLVVIVPSIVPLKYVSTTLGVHKAVSATRYRDIYMFTSFDSWRTPDLLYFKRLLDFCSTTILQATDRSYSISSTFSTRFCFLTSCSWSAYKA